MLDNKRNKEMKDLLHTSISTILDKLDKIENFTLEHAPDVCKEVYTLKIVECKNEVILYGYWVTVSALLLGGSCYINHLLWGQYDYVPSIFALIIACISSVGVFVNLCSMLRELLCIKEITASPKYHIIKELRSLL